MSLIERLLEAGILVIPEQSDESKNSYCYKSLTIKEYILAMSIIDPRPAETETNFSLPVRAPIVIASDFIVQSPKVPDVAKQAMREAVAEGKKKDKSIAFMVLAMARYIEELEDRVAGLEKKI